ncbi:MAG: DUF3300 domain-containing protein [Deltaproteobacteria bacterium]|nr:DUF3300 domain-containing protein [Candidatus Tharpella sp.]
MKRCKNYLQLLTFFGLFCFLLSTSVFTQNVSAAEAPKTDKTASSGASASQEELAQILAPIALYPDTLLAQMFMASTYPLEIVEADRFVKKNSSLKDDALDKALKEKEWDVSVKSLSHFPTVLATMSDNLDATKRLGDYFLDDQKAVMAMVQSLRAKAHEKGNLKTTDEQKVVVEEKTIIIESAKPDVVYVPSYSCSYVYGSWWYPHYPPYAWYPPPPRYGFGVGVVVGIGLGRWCHTNWHRGDIDIDINRTARFNKNVNIGGGKGDRKSWKHNARHRKGVAYNNRAARKKFGQSNRVAKQRDIGRGRKAQGLDRKTRDSIKQQGLKNSVRRPNNKKQNRMAKPRVSQPNSGKRRDLSGRQPAVNRPQTRNSNAFKRSGSGSRTRNMSRRGNASRSRSFNRSGGGRRGGGRRR